MSRRECHRLAMAELLAAGSRRRDQLLRLPSVLVTVDLGEALANESARALPQEPAHALDCADLAVRVGLRLRGERTRLPVPVRLLGVHGWIRHAEALRHLERGEEAHQSRELAMQLLRPRLPGGQRLRGLLKLAEAGDLLQHQEVAAADSELSDAIDFFVACRWPSMAVYARLMRCATWSALLPQGVVDRAGLRHFRFKKALAEGAETWAPGLVAQLEELVEAGAGWSALLEALERRRGAFEWAAEA